MLRSRLSFFCFIAPSLAGILVFYLIPFLGGTYYSLVTDNIKRSFVWFDNYKSVLGNAIFRLALKNTLLFSILCAPTIVVLSMLLATTFQHILKTFALRIAMLLPYVVPSVSVVLIWKILFGNSGPINAAAYRIFGNTILWLSSQWLRTPVVFMYLWRNLGFFH